MCSSFPFKIFMSRLIIVNCLTCVFTLVVRFSNHKSHVWTSARLFRVVQPAWAKNSNWLDHRTLVDSRSVKCEFSLCSTSDTVKSCGAFVSSTGWRLRCRSGPPVDGPKDPWPCVLSLPGRFVGDSAPPARDNTLVPIINFTSVALVIFLCIRLCALVDPPH